MAYMPKKGILKSSSSFEKPEPYRSTCNAKEMKWDEMNILQTLHPPDKDYGHMKIEEPKTPFSTYKDPEESAAEASAAGDSSACCRMTEPDEPRSEDEDEADGLDADLLAKKIQLGCDKLPKAMEEADDDDDDDDDPRYINETAEERAKRKMFEQKRKMHYNEFSAVKLARKLMEEDEEEDEDEDDKDQGHNGLVAADDEAEHGQQPNRTRAADNGSIADVVVVQEPASVHDN